MNLDQETFFDYSASSAVQRKTLWCLKPQWLQNPKFLDYVGQNIDDYFQLNTIETSASIRWEAFKPFIRGQMMGYTRNKSNKQYFEILKLERDIKELELEIIGGNNREKTKLAIIKAKYNRLSTNKALVGLIRLKQTYYDQEEKTGK